MKMNQVDLKVQYQSIKDEINEAVNRVLESCQFINGPDVELLEKEIAEFCGVKYGIAASSGTDALFIPLKSYGISNGDEVITTPFTFIATAEVIALSGARPVFVDIEYDSFNMDMNLVEKAITPRTKAIIPVHLYGQMADMEKLLWIAKKYNLFIIEDACQAIGAEQNGKRACSVGDCAALSFFPSKNLGCYGDGGMILTNNSELATKMKQLTNHGQVERYKHKYIGINGRLDTIQAAILRIKLKHLNKWLENREKIAENYDKGFCDLPIKTPVRIKGNRHVFNQYTIRTKKRDELKNHLEKNGIPTAIHYPMPLHLQECFKYLGYKENDFPVSEEASKEVLSLPMFPEMTLEQQKEVIDSIRSFFI